MSTRYCLARLKREEARRRPALEEVTMMDPLAVVRTFNDAWNRHDIQGVLEMVSADCVFESTAPAPDGQRHRGSENLRLVWEPIVCDPASRFTVEEQFAVDDRVVQRWRYDWQAGHVRGVDVFRVRDGRVTEKLSYVKG
jgi:ketosteroid isomerase-like protein